MVKREDWVSSFNVIGEAKVNDYTFKIDEKSEKSAWIYNSMNLGIDCGEKHGYVYCEMIGGYSSETNSVIYAHGKKDDGSDDFSKSITVDWDDRFNDDILETIGDLSFITIGLEKTDKGKTYYKRFLSTYDAIAYVNEHLEEGTVLNVKGRLKYSIYNDRVQVKKEVTSIALSRAETSADYKASFTQSILLNKDSATAKNIDKDTDTLYVDAIVLDYVKELNGVEIKGQYPFEKQFIYELPKDEKQRKKVMDGLFKVRKDITQINFEGDFVEGGAVITATLDDLPDDVKELIDMGVYTEEEALQKCSNKGNREQKMVLRKPVIKLVGEDKEKVAVVQKFEQRFTEEDLMVDVSSKVEKEVSTEQESKDKDDDLDWLNSL